MKRIGIGTALVLLAAAPAAAQQTARVVTYQEAVAIALEQSTGVRLAANVAASDAATVRQSQQAFLPSLQVSTSGSQSYGRGFDQGAGQVTTQSTRALNAGISSSLVLFDGSARRAQLRAAELGRDASQSQLARARQTAVFAVASGFTALRNAEEQVRVRREDLAAREAEQAQIQALVDARSRPVSDLYQQQANVAAARAQRVQAERAVEVARTDLVQTLQLDPTGSYDFRTGSAPAPAASTLLLDSLVTLALANRTDLDALEQERAAAQQGVRVARAATLPTVSVSAGYNTAFNSATDEAFLDQLNDRRGGSVSVGVTLPIFDRGAASAAEQRARIAVDNASIALEAQRNAIAIEVRRAYLDREAARAQLQAAEAQLQAAQRALEASQERYRVGAAALLEVTQARAAQVEAASALVTARSTLQLQEVVIGYHIGAI